MSGCDWGVLTNGMIWRICHRRHSEDTYFELNLFECLEDEDIISMLLFYLFLGKKSFVDGSNFLFKIYEKLRMTPAVGTVRSSPRESATESNPQDTALLKNKKRSTNHQQENPVESNAEKASSSSHIADSCRSISPEAIRHQNLESTCSSDADVIEFLFDDDYFQSLLEIVSDMFKSIFDECKSLRLFTHDTNANFSTPIVFAMNLVFILFVERKNLLPYFSKNSKYAKECSLTELWDVSRRSSQSFDHRFTLPLCHLL